MPPENSPTPAPGQRQRVMLAIIAVLLIASALLAAFVLKKLPVPVRAFIAFGDAVAAIAILFLLRKNPLRPR